MSDVLSIGIDFEKSFLEDLVSDLKGTFHCICHAGKYNDKKFIRDRQEYIRKKYEKGLSNCLSFESWFIGDAYGILMELGKHPSSQYNTPEWIQHDAQEALYNDLMEGINDAEVSLFRKEHASNLGIEAS